MRTHTHTGHGSFEGRGGRLYDLMARYLMGGLYRRITEDVALVAPWEGEVLDVGTGPGVLLGRIARARPDLRVSGVDPSADMVAAATRNVAEVADRVTARVGEAADLPFPDGTFDLVVTSFSMHHWADVPAAVPELARVLRPGGEVVVFDFLSAPFDALDGAVRREPVFADQPVRHAVIRTGQLHLRRVVRHVLTAAAGPV